jgi:RNA polymerase sigma factor (TIGR02999 family)
MNSVTQILNALQQGQSQITDELLPLVYDELRQMAAQRMAQERPGQTLDATALVHEAYLRLVDTKDQPHWQNRRHFFAAAAEAMRRILVDNARRKQTAKHGGQRVREELDEAHLVSPEPDDDILALDEALAKLTQQDPIKAELVKLRYFAGMTADEAAETLGISSTTGERYWNYARAWLHQQIQLDRAAGSLPESAE